MARGSERSIEKYIRFVKLNSWVLIPEVAARDACLAKLSYDISVELLIRVSEGGMVGHCIEA